MIATIEIFLDGQWRTAGRFEPDEGGLSLGVAGAGRFDYDMDYAVEQMGGIACRQVSLGYPVNFELVRTDCWPAFLLDLLPSGAGRRAWLERLKLPDNESADWFLLINAAGNPPGNLRVGEAVLPLLESHPGFSREEILMRHENFVEYAESRGAIVAGASDVQGEAPKFLLNQDQDGRWHADGSLGDEKAAKFWIVKFPRGKTREDRAVLHNEAPYYEVARDFGLRTGEPLEWIGDALFIPRFDCRKKDGKVERYGLESLAAASGISVFGRNTLHTQYCETIARYVTDPGEELVEYVKRDILNTALRNTDNHGRNTALIKLSDGTVALSPLYDFAPMFLDPAGIPRATRWGAELEPVPGRPIWHKILAFLAPYCPGTDLGARIAPLGDVVAKLPETMRNRGVEAYIVERLSKRITEIASDIRKLK